MPVALAQCRCFQLSKEIHLDGRQGKPGIVLNYFFMPSVKTQTPDELTDRIQKDLKSVRYSASPLGLLEGDMGRLLFMLEYARFRENKKEIALLKKEIARAFSQIEKNIHNVTFSSGLLGFLAFLNYYNTYSGDELELDSETAETLQHVVTNQLKNDLLVRNNYDYMIGAVAAGHYFLDQHKTAPIVTGLIDFFDSTKIIRSDGITWQEPEGLFPLVKRKNAVNLGTAHGIIPVVLFLAKCFCAGIAPERTKPLASEALRFIESQQIKVPGSAFLYPAFIENGKQKTSRHGWCYGDLGVALLFLQCATLLREEKYKARALEGGLYSCNIRNIKTARTEDAAICHGTGGLYLQYQILFNHFGHNVFAETAAYWKNKTIAYSKYKDGPGGYMVPTLSGMQGNPGFLGGAAGIGLSFLYEMNGGKAPWLKFLLLPG